LNDIVKIQSFELLPPEDLQSFILENYGIKADVQMINGKNAIKIDNHFSLFSLIKKMKFDFSFTVYHRKEENSYVLFIENI